MESENAKQLRKKLQLLKAISEAQTKIEAIEIEKEGLEKLLAEKKNNIKKLMEV